MNIIPSPKKLTLLEGTIKNTGVNPTVICSDNRVERAAQKLPVNKCGIELLITVKGESGEGYTLKIENEKIEIVGESAQGAFYGIQTLRQILTEDEIPCVYIEDKPDFKVRGVYHDVTRGRIPKMETFKQYLDMLALYKTNAFQVYSEHALELDEFKDVTNRTGCITKEEIRKIDDYCYENFIEFVPSIATFGHLYELLATEEYKHLRILDDYEPTDSFWLERLNHHTLDPLKPESFEIVKSMIDQTAPLYRSNKFNICGDETFDLFEGKYKDSEPGKLYFDFMGKVIEYVKSLGKEVMMWPDAYRRHPEDAKSLDKDVALLTYYYLPDVERLEPTLQQVSAEGRKFYVVPAAYSWCRLIENIQIGEPNITKWIDFGAQYGAEGIYNAIWGDWGHPCSIEMHTYALILGAEKSWNNSMNPDKSFYDKVDECIYGKSGAVELLKMVSDWASDMFYWQLGKYYSNKLYNGSLQVDLPTPEQVINARDNCLCELEKLKNDKWGNDEYRVELMVALEGIAVTAEFFSKILGMSLERKTNTVEWLERYRAKWLEKNKLGELWELEKMFMYLDALPPENAQ